MAESKKRHVGSLDEMLKLQKDTRCFEMLLNQGKTQ